MSEPVRRFVQLLSSRCSSTVLCSDFDGTLARIVVDPESAVPVTGARAALLRLASRLHTVAVVSGRPLDFLAARLEFDAGSGIELFGLYGAQHRLRNGAVAEDTVTEDERRRFGDIGEAARAISPDVLVEDKVGSLALHWRSVPEAAAAVVELARRELDKGGIEIREGKMLVDLVLSGAPDKGDALHTLIGSDVTQCCYLGDDVGDLDAFDELDHFAALGNTAVRIAVGSPDMPEELGQRADLVLSGPEAAVAFLEELADAAVLD